MATPTDPTKPPIAAPPAQPEPSTGQFVGLYTMFFRSTTNSLQSKNFRFNGSLKEARERAQRHCDIMNYRLHFVQPLISDLKKEEDFYLGVAASARVETNLQKELA